MTRRRSWLLPETPDVLGMLAAQFDVTLEGLRDLERWARSGGDPEAALGVRAAEHRADDQKVELRGALRAAFSTPLDSEDLYLISERLDNLMNAAKDVVREAEIMRTVPDASAAALAALVVEGVEHLQVAVHSVLSDPDRATAEADAATKCQRRMEKVYRTTMSELFDADGAGDLGMLLARRELYARLLRAGEYLVAVSERVWYAVVKES